MDKLRKIFVAAMICLVVFSVAVYAAIQRTYHFGADTTGQVQAYKDEGLTLPLSNLGSFDFPATVSDLSVVNIWVKNIGTNTLHVTPSISLPSGCTVTVDPAFDLTQSQVAKLNMTIHSPTGHVTWDLNLDYP
jgi:hypothetical protein